MATIRLIKRRIKSVANIAQITKAMELVAASKMKKAQVAALSGKLYAEKIYSMVMNLAKKIDIKEHPLLLQPKTITGRRLSVVVSTNKGLCGGLNTNLFRFFIKEYTDDNSAVDFITVGQKGADFLVRMKKKVIADFSQTVPFIHMVPAIIEFITREYTTGTCDGVDLVYSDFISALKHIPKRKIILPLAIEQQNEGKEHGLLNLTIEPSPDVVFDSLLPHYLENQLRDAILEAEASEHSARMVAMRNATDNALSLMQDLTLVYNKIRQEKITYEITDMVTARLAAES